jgi:bifunctional non-homologous end joining protein LigD
MSRAAKSRSAGPPTFVRPQLTRLVETSPASDAWLHEIKFDGYRIHARLDAGRVKLLTRTGLDWTERYEVTAAAIANLKARALSRRRAVRP